MKRISEYIDGYFEGTLTEREEAVLKAFLASPDGQAQEYDEVRAVMGYFSAGRKLGEGREAVRRRRRAFWSRTVAAAAGLALVVSLGVVTYRKENICVSFVDGKKVTDREVVMNDVDNILADLLSGREGMEEQLNYIFGR